MAIDPLGLAGKKRTIRNAPTVEGDEVSEQEKAEAVEELLAAARRDKKRHDWDVIE